MWAVRTTGAASRSTSLRRASLIAAAASPRLQAPDRSSITAPPPRRPPPSRHHLHNAPRRLFSTTPLSRAKQPYLLADVGEGITECEVVKWHVSAGDHVAEFDPLCEVQSDKASVEITSRFEGTVGELACEVGGIVRVGTPLCSIDVVGEEEEGVGEGSVTQEVPGRAEYQPSEEGKGGTEATAPATTSSSEATPPTTTHFDSTLSGLAGIARQPNHAALATLATPAVRRICREHKLEVTAVSGTGKDGRVTKEDVLRHIGHLPPASTPAKNGGHGYGALTEDFATIQDTGVMRGTDVPGEAGLTVDNARARAAAAAAAQESTPTQPTSLDPQPLTGIRKAMFRSLSASASIPVFTFTEEIDVTELETLRKQVNADLQRAASPRDGTPPKVTLLAFLLKALSTAMREHPLFLSRLNVPPPSPLPPSQGQSEAAAPADTFARAASAARLIPRSSHDISIALSTPSGLLTPTLRSVETLSVLEIAGRVAALQQKAAAGGLGAQEMGDGGTLTLSNIGSIGGGLAGTTPVLPPTGQLAIGAVGRVIELPRYSDTIPGGDKGGAGEVATLVRRKILPVTFAGDHRVLQGTELARLVLRWKEVCERPGSWLVAMR